MTSAEGRYSFTIEISRETVVRVVFAPSGPCERILSTRRTITVIR